MSNKVIGYCKECGRGFCKDALIKNNLLDPQPDPIPNKSKPVWEMVIEDMHERDLTCGKKYGTRLQIHNGRDFLVDAYQEALDLVVYLRGLIEEDKSK